MRLAALRFLSFATDLLIIAGASVPLLLLTFLLPEDEIDWLQFLAFLFFLSYFIFWELSNKGATPGRQLFRIALRKVDDTEVRFHESFLRMALFLAFPIGFDLLQEILWLNRSAESGQIFWLIDSFLSVFGILLLPMSIALGGGSRGIYDLLAQTKVVSSAKPVPTTGEPSAANSWLTAVAVASFLSLLLAWPWSHVVSGMTGRFETTEANPNTNTMSRFIIDNFELARSIHESGTFFRGRIQLEGTLWQEGMAKTYSLAHNPEGLGQVIDFSKLKPVGVVTYKVFSSPKGILSSDFQRAVAARIAAQSVASGYLIEVVFVLNRRVGFLVVGAEKRLLALWVVVKGPDGVRPKLIIAEPSQSTSISTGIQPPSWRLLEPR